MVATVNCVNLCSLKKIGLNIQDEDHGEGFCFKYDYIYQFPIDYKTMTSKLLIFWQSNFSLMVHHHKLSQNFL